MKRQSKTYDLVYQDDKIMYMYSYTNKKELNKAIKCLPKELVDFSVHYRIRETYWGSIESETDLTADYVDYSIRKVVLK